ncbi:cytochrome C oxidase subunit IV family protein [candidate division KSB1 bacterium]
MSAEKPHITGYGFYIGILLVLLSFTAVSVYVTTIELGPLSTFTAMFIATLKSTLVLLYFMHLRFDKKIFIAMFLLVIAVFIAIILITFIDYIYR